MADYNLYYVPEKFSPEEFFNRIKDDYLNLGKKFLWQKNHHFITEIFPMSETIVGLYTNPMIDGYTKFVIRPYEQILIYSDKHKERIGNVHICGFGRECKSCKKELEEIAQMRLRRLTKKELQFN
jgi:hypothetical protein